MDYETLNLLFRINKEFSHKQTRGRLLTDTELMILSFVQANPNSSQDDAARAVKTDKTTVSKCVASLHAKRLLKRKQDTKDKRIMRLRVSPDGLKALKGMKDIHEQWLDKTLSVLSAEEREQFFGYCKRVMDAALADGNPAKQDEKSAE